jgi:LEA14-like dessication related protein
MAMSVMAVTVSRHPTKHPKIFERSTTNTLRTPIKVKLKVKVSHPLPIEGGGRKANTT